MGDAKLEMRVWGKTRPQGTTPASVARRALEGASRAELVREAVKVLLESRQAERVGVWIQSEGERGCNAGNTLTGLVGESEAREMPKQWSSLTLDALPGDILSAARGAEQELPMEGSKPALGVLVDMRRALWFPVESRGHLRGVVFVGGRGKSSSLPWSTARAVAAELSLALELQDERRKTEAHRANTTVTCSLLERLDRGTPASQALSEIAEQCTREGGLGRGALAIFAAIGRAVRDGKQLRTKTDEGEPGSSDLQMEFLWRSGESDRTQRLAEEPFQSVWREAVKQRRVVGTEVHNWSLGAAARVVAIPLQADAELLGVLVAGIAAQGSSLVALESLELRAALAAAVLARERIDGIFQSQASRERALIAECQATIVEVGPDARVEGIRAGRDGLADELIPWAASGQAGKSHFMDFFSPESAEEVNRWFEASKAHQTGHVLEEARLRNGVAVRLRLLPNSITQNATVLMRAVAATERKSRRDALRELRDVIEWLEEGVVLFGVNDEIRAMNARLIQVLGFGPEEVKQLRSAEEMVAAITARMKNPGSYRQTSLSSGGSAAAIREEIQIERPVERLVERVGHPILDESGAIVARVEIYRDLTAQRLLQSRVLRTGKLAELGQMLTTVAHELSNPLTSILGYAQRMVQRGDTRGGSRAARQIFQEAERASAILRQLLLSARESRPERRRVSLNRLVTRAVELHGPDVVNEKLHIEVDLEPALPLVQGDQGQLQQVLQNLIGNARQALAGQKNPTIRVSTRRVPGNRVLLEVADNGSGIPASIQSRIFDPFFTTKPAGMGTGLGLSIVSGIVREHGGEVRMSSSPGSGAVFSVQLPAIETLEIESGKFGKTGISRHELITSPERSHRPAEAASVLARWAGARVLVLEDEPTVAHLIADVLEDDGLEVDTVLDSRQALSRARNQDYALVICDMKMPDLDGEEFYRTLVREKNPLHHRFLFVTGDVLSAHTRNFLERHALPYLAKPFRVDELTDKIRRVFERGDSVTSASDSTKKNAATST